MKIKFCCRMIGSIFFLLPVVFAVSGTLRANTPVVSLSQGDVEKIEEALTEHLKIFSEYNNSNAPLDGIQGSGNDESDKKKYEAAAKIFNIVRALKQNSLSNSVENESLKSPIINLKDSKKFPNLENVLLFLHGVQKKVILFESNLSRDLLSQRTGVPVKKIAPRGLPILSYFGNEDCSEAEFKALISKLTWIQLAEEWRQMVVLPTLYRDQFGLRFVDSMIHLLDSNQDPELSFVKKHYKFLKSVNSATESASTLQKIEKQIENDEAVIASLEAIPVAEVRGFILDLQRVAPSCLGGVENRFDVRVQNLLTLKRGEFFFKQLESEYRLTKKIPTTLEDFAALKKYHPIYGEYLDAFNRPYILEQKAHELILKSQGASDQPGTADEIIIGRLPLGKQPKQKKLSMLKPIQAPKKIEIRDNEIKAMSLNTSSKVETKKSTSSPVTAPKLEAAVEVAVEGEVKFLSWGQVPKPCSDDDLEQMKNSVRLIPKFKQSKLLGCGMVNVHPGSRWMKLGFREDDHILEIAGATVNDVDDFLVHLKQVCEASVEVKVRRGSSEFILTRTK